ncbi:hypothetical protein ACFL0I_00755 [Gemmatimonadota bacterium]
MPQPSLIQRLKDRKLVQWAVAYLAGAWVLVEATGHVVEQFHWPIIVSQVITIMAFFGFFLVVVIAWYHGEEGRQWVSGPELLIIALLLLISGGVLSMLGDGERVSEPGEAVASDTDEDGRPRIAVLPCENFSPDPEEAFFASGIHEEILLKLQKISSLFSIGRTSVLQYAENPPPVNEIADALGVGFLGECSVRKEGDRIRLTFQLLDGTTGGQLWAENYDRDLSAGNLLDIQSDIARQVARALEAELTPEERSALEQDRTEVTAAYEEHLLGRFHLHQRTTEGFERAIAEFERAVELDPTYAPAYASLASAYSLCVTYGYRSGPAAYEATTRALIVADRALELDPNQAEAYAARAYVLRYMWAPFEGLASDYLRAIQLQPSSGDIHGWYGHLLTREGRFEEAMVEHQNAVTLDPLAPGRRAGFTWDALAARQYDVVVREADRALALVPGFFDPLGAKALAHLLVGEEDLCLPLDLGPYAGIKAMCLHAAGEVEAASAMVDSVSAVVEASRASDPIPGSAIQAASIATYYAWVGEPRQSLAWFERALALSPESTLYRILESEVYDNVRSDAEFWSGIESLREDLRARLNEGRQGG